MKSKFSFILLILLSSCGVSHQEIDSCPLWIEQARSLESISSIKKKKKSTDSNYDLYYQPLLLPFSIRWNGSKGFYIEHNDKIEIATPIGSFGLEYSIASRNDINGIEITPNDFIVSIVDKNKGSQQLFKIKGYNRLKVVLSGTTTIDAQSGFVQIDATKSKINKIEFFDNSVAKLINKTDRFVTYYLQIGNSMNESTISYRCIIPGMSYVTIPVNDLNSLVTAKIFIKVKNDNIDNDTFQEIKKMVTYGDVCEITESSTKELALTKIQ